MKSRGLVVVVAGLLAILATGAVFLYVRGVKQDVKTGGGDVSVVVAKRDIAAGTELDELVSQGAFAVQLVSSDAVVRDAVTSLDQLKSRTTAFPILEGEQVSTARLQGSETQAEGGSLGIAEGYEAVTLSLDVERAGGGVIQQGDHVTIYAEFSEPQAASASVDATVKQTKDKITGTIQADITATHGVSVTLVPYVRVLKIDKPASTTDTSNLLVTLELLPADAARLIFSQEQGVVWLALLPPNQEGTAHSPVTALEVIK
jgi:pilus assembly protein CpaB